MSNPIGVGQSEWTNWSGLATGRPQKVRHPRDTGDVVSAIIDAIESLNPTFPTVDPAVRAEYRRADDADQRDEVDFDDRHEDHGLHDGRHHVADVQRAGDAFIRHPLP